MRGGVKRSRNGCAACKEKKLKCDETKPVCLRCSKRGIVCPRYGKVDKSSSTHPSDSPTPSTVEEHAGSGIGIPDLIIQGHHSKCDPTIFDDLANDIFRFETQGSLNANADTFTHSVDSSHWNYVEDAEAGRNSYPASTQTLTPISTVPSTVTSVQRAPRRDSSISSSDLSHSRTVDGPGPSARPRGNSQSTQPLPRLMNDPSSILVEYYFKEVAGLFSCYDSHLNPFRSTVSRLWNTSPSVYYVVQSMSAACLADAFPQWNVIGTQMRNKAAASVDKDIGAFKVDTGSLLAMVMLGLTASWHNANDLGRTEFIRARGIIGAMLAGKDLGQVDNNERNLQFFQEAMIYWEMLLSYVIDDTWPALPAGPKPTSNPDARHGRVEPSTLPHPWTGVARKAQAIVFEVGRLIRQERHRIRSLTFTTSADIDHARKSLITAERLADRLQKLTFPAEEGIVSPADDQTPVKHFLAIAEAYRLTGLLQLYRVFPDILEAQIANSPHAPRRSHSHSGSSGSVASGLSISMRLTKLALDILDLLRAIPIESRTRCVQPFLLVAVTSELHITSPSINITPHHAHRQQQDLHLNASVDGAPSAMDVLQARKFVIGRLSTFEHVLPAKPIRQMLDIVTETWHRIDLGLQNVYWMDVMIEKGWETMMG